MRKEPTVLLRRILILREKEQSEQKIHFLPGAMRENRRLSLNIGDGVLFVERSSELLAYASLSLDGGGAVKASLNRAFSIC